MVPGGPQRAPDLAVDIHGRLDELNEPIDKHRVVRADGRGLVRQQELAVLQHASRDG